MYQKIINPYSGRKVSIFSKTGKNILKNYLRNVLGGTVPLDATCHYSMMGTECRQNPNDPRSIRCLKLDPHSYGKIAKTPPTKVTDRGEEGVCGYLSK